MLTPRQFSELHQVAYTTVMGWLRKGHIPEAQKRSIANTHYWEIPSNAPKPGTRTGRPTKKSKSNN